jgi:putative RecB family exonuclease
LPNIYSNSKLGTFENCPFSYKLRYIDKIKVDKDTIERFLGNVVHSTLEYTYRKANYEGMKPEKEKVAALFHWYWKKDWNDRIFIVKKQYSAEHYRSIGEKCILRYYDRFAPFTQNKILVLEQKVEILLDAKGEHKMTGIIDRIDETPAGEIEIHDYKTGMTPPSQQDIEEERQLALYQIGVMEFTGPKKVTLMWHYVMSGLDFSTTKDAEQLEQVKKDALEVIEKIEGTTEFLKHPGPLCNYCEYFGGHCDGGKDEHKGY